MEAFTTGRIICQHCTHGSTLFLDLRGISLVPFLRKSCAGRRGNGNVWLFAPPTMLLLDWVVSFAKCSPSRRSHVLFFCSKFVWFFGVSQQLYSMQMLLNFGTHPFICLPVTLIFVGFNLIPSTFWMNSVIETRLGTLLSCLQMVRSCHELFPAQSRSGRRSSTRARGAQHSCEFHATRGAVKRGSQRVWFKGRKLVVASTRYYF